MTIDHPKYLKKIGAPDWDYHVWTPLLAAREDMLPLDRLAKGKTSVDLNRLRNVIRERGLSLSQAASEIGMDKGRLSRLLSGETSEVREENQKKIELWLRR